MPQTTYGVRVCVCGGGVASHVLILNAPYSSYVSVDEGAFLVMCDWLLLVLDVRSDTQYVVIRFPGA